MEENDVIFDIDFALEMLDGDKELLFVLLESFLSDTSFSVQTLQQFIREGKKSEAAAYVHAVKGAGRQLGAKRLSEVAQKLEDVLRGKDTGNIFDLSQKMNEEYKIALEETKKILSDKKV